MHITTEVMDPDAEWSFGPDLPSARIYHCITPMTTDAAETRFILIGGETDGLVKLASTHLYDWAVGNTWTQLGNLAADVQRHACAPMTLSDGTNIVLTTHGKEVDPAVEFLVEGAVQWTAGPPLAAGRK